MFNERVKDYNNESLCELLGKQDWSKVLGSQDVNIVWNNFKDIFIAVLEIIASV